ncbi:MAG: nucleotide sugar dehydrogenase [Myxococcales bacterium]|nr:nucleotide sugar dehydrogenase [Myxococcales bacterium]MCB9531958.1 nucleotide sugar dehydrogenase [Myxococcales bacterium]MCB9532829.1 nucleotide sugar dehydrogenase [Myxococcales bacterium]
MSERREKIGVVGLGYVGLPVALAFAKKFPGTIGVDIDARRVAELERGHDRTNEVDTDELRASTLSYTTDARELGACSFIVVTVPTPIDANRQPDLTPVVKASESVGRVLSPGTVVVYESTVYPGVTEEICGPILERESGLRCGVDFTLGYSPERINPGDRVHTLERITKVVSGQDAATLDRVASAYGAIIDAGIHRAPSIMVAEAAKVIENTQRDLNIALMNELALIFDKLGIRTVDVLAAAGTKWNFLKFSPGLVGGHCIGVDPYYLTAKAESLGYHPEVILAGRRINDGMGAFVARKLIRQMIQADRPIKGARVAVLGLTFKENVPDLRNSRVPDILHELREFGIDPMVHDPWADADEAQHEYGVSLTPWDELRDLDALVLAVSHQRFLDLGVETLLAPLGGNGIVVDVKSMLDPSSVPAGVSYWSL